MNQQNHDTLAAILGVAILVFIFLMCWLIERGGEDE